MAKGSRQSPIDIIPKRAPYDPSLGPIALDYNLCTSINICNNGHSVVVEFDDTDDRSGKIRVWFIINDIFMHVCHKPTLRYWCVKMKCSLPSANIGN